jgi:hypothetical protein
VCCWFQLGEQPLHAAQSGIDSMNTIEELQRLLHLATEERAVFLQAIEGLDSENKVLRKKLEQCRDALQAKANGDDEASKLIARLTSDKKRCVIRGFQAWKSDVKNAWIAVRRLQWLV